MPFLHAKPLNLSRLISTQFMSLHISGVHSFIQEVKLGGGGGGGGTAILFIVGERLDQINTQSTRRFVYCNKKCIVT